MKALLPIISKKENKKDFLDAALKKGDEAVLLLVIDKDAMAGMFGFATNEIKQGNDLIEELKTALKEKKVKTEEVVEWGNTGTKIENMAQLKKVDKIILVEQDNEYFKKLINELKQKINVPVETFKVKEEAPVEEKKIDAKSVGDFLFGRKPPENEIKKV